MRMRPEIGTERGQAAYRTEKNGCAGKIYTYKQSMPLIDAEHEKEN